MLEERDLTRAWLARRIGRSAMWVHRKLAADSLMRIEDYSLLKDAIEAVVSKSSEK